MPDGYSLVPVDHQPEFEPDAPQGVSFHPVDHSPDFGDWREQEAQANLAAQPQASRSWADMVLAPSRILNKTIDGAIDAFGHPVETVSRALGTIATIPQRAIEGGAADVQHWGEPGYEPQSIAPATDAAMMLMGGAGVVPAEANILRTGASLLRSRAMRQNPFEPTPELVDAVHAAAKASPDMHIGLRIDNGRNFSKGDSLPESRVWVDGVPQEDTVGGVSTLGLGDAVSPESISRALHELGPYVGDQLVLVGGRGASIGEDAGEHIIRNGRAVDVFSPPKPTMGVRGGAGPGEIEAAFKDSK